MNLDRELEKDPEFKKLRDFMKPQRKFKRALKWKKNCFVIRGFEPERKYREMDLIPLEEKAATLLQKADTDLKRFLVGSSLSESNPDIVEAFSYQVLIRSLKGKFHPEEVLAICAYQARCQKFRATNLEQFLRKNLRVPTHVDYMDL